MPRDWPEAPKPKEVPHPRLGPYRRRAGRITDPEGAAGLIYVDVEVSSTRLGHLWWRRWSPWRETVVLHVEYPDGELDDVYLDDELEGEIDSWDRGEFHGHPEEGGPTLFRVEWLNDEETVSVKAKLIGE